MTEYKISIPSGLENELALSIARGVMTMHPDGTYSTFGTKVLVSHIDGLKVEIFSNDHPPPHFRVKFQGSTANFRISDGACINGSGEVMRYHGNINRWWEINKSKLIECWNTTRPSGCPVGEYRGAA